MCVCRHALGDGELHGSGSDGSGDGVGERTERDGAITLARSDWRS